MLPWKPVNSSPRACIPFSMFTCLFIEVRETLEAAKNPRNRKINPKAISIIGPTATCSPAYECAWSQVFVLDRCLCAPDCNCDQAFLLCSWAQGCTCSLHGHSSVGVLKPKCSAIDCTASFPNSSVYAPSFPNLLPFLPWPAKTHKTQKKQKKKKKKWHKIIKLRI